MTAQAVTVLENTGPSSISAAVVGFDILPDDTPHKFLYGGAFLSHDNSLPPGELACTEPILRLADGIHLVLNQIGSFDSPLIGRVTGTFGSPEIAVDGTTLAFDLPYPAATGERIAGIYSFLSESPCASTAPQVTPSTPLLAPSARPGLDFFGVVVSVSRDPLKVEVKGDIVDILVAAHTKIKLPRVDNATLAHLSPGDVVAVSLTEGENGLVAGKIRVIPDKTKFRHIPGQVTGLSRSRINIKAHGIAGEIIDFDLTPGTKINIHGNAPDLEVGSFVIVGAVRNSATGGLGPRALEINVINRKVKAAAPPEIQAGGDEPESTANIQGVFQEVDAEGRWIIGDTPVVLNPETVIDDGLVVGQILEVEAVIQGDGTLLALAIESEDQSLKVSNTTKLEGVFQGIEDGTGNWIISGTSVAVDTGTDTDGIPALGQAVKVKAVLQEDGSLLAREIENRGAGRRSDARKGRLTKIEGTFQGTDESGRWLVNGAAIAVDESTRLKGTPAVGRRIEVKAVVQSDGTLVATKIKSEERNIHKPENRAKLRGQIQKVLEDGTVQINGISVALSALTRLSGLTGDLKAGDLVEVDALVQPDGSLVASEVDSAEGGLAELSKVEIEGTVVAINPDGSIVVNGITVAISALSKVADVIVPGQSVKLEGQFTPRGLLIAHEVKNKGRKSEGKFTEARVEEIVDLVNHNDNGQVVSLVVDGLTVAVEALTESEITLEPGAMVEIEAVVSDGKFTASKIEGRGKGKSQSNNAGKKGVKLEGAIEALETDNRGRVISVMVNGIRVAVAALDKSHGSLQVGQTVELETNNTGGVLRASKVKTKKPEKAKQEFEGFELHGIVDLVDRDDAGNLLALTVNGHKIAVETLTKVEGDIHVGARVKLEGIVVGRVLLASDIEGPKTKGKPSTAGSKGRGSSNVETKNPEKPKQEFQGFELHGIVDVIERDDAGNLWALMVNGHKIAVETLTEVEGDIEIGVRVKVEGIVNDRVLLAREIKGPKGKDKSESEKDDDDSYSSSARPISLGPGV